MIYGQYGLREIDSVSSATGVSSYDLSLIDASGDSSWLFLRAETQTSNDTQSVRMNFLDTSDTAVVVHQRTMSTGTTSTTSHYGTNTNVNLSTQYWGVGNANASTWATAETVAQKVFIKYQRNSSAPISRITGHVLTNVVTNSGNYAPSFNSFYLADDVEIDTIRIIVSSGTMTGKAVLYSICGNAVD